MRCPRCESSDTDHLKIIETLTLHLWRCHGCGAQFTSSATTLVLNVDDRPAARDMRSKALRAAGYAVADAGTSAAAWEQARQLRPSVILMDVNLPDGDGRQLCRRMSADVDLKHIPVILISATIGQHEVVAARDYGAIAFLREPCRAETLTAAVEHAINEA